MEGGSKTLPLAGDLVRELSPKWPRRQHARTYANEYYTRAKEHLLPYSLAVFLSFVTPKTKITWGCVKTYSHRFESQAPTQHTWLST